jgi:hypothetical protein
MKQLFNIISAFAYHISILIYITILIILLIILIYTQNTKSNLDPSHYQSEAGFNYLEDIGEFN